MSGLHETPPSVPADHAAAIKCELAGEVLRAFGPQRFPAIGWSMLPAVWPGDTFVVEPVTPDQACVGDVVVVGRNGTLCAHRVVAVNDKAGNQQWITQGDALAAPDPAVSANELLGRVTYLIRAGRCIAVDAKLNVSKRWIAKIVRRSVPAARALVFLHGMVRTLQKPVPLCQD